MTPHVESAILWGQQTPASEGDWVAWVGTWEDLEKGREGQYRIRLMDNTLGWDTAYPGLELLQDGTFVTTSYGHWDLGEAPYVVSVRFTLDELDKLAQSALTLVR